jgi:flavin reductase (DIM6/NTAB) family NADH-FMN oxidoreductase RutF
MCPSVCTKTGWVRHQLTIAKAARAYDLLVQLECKVVQTLSLGDLPFSGSMPHKLLHTVTVAVRDALKLRYHRK